MRVLFVSNLYPPVVYGGYERLCFEVAQALTERGCVVGVLTSSHGSREQDYPGQTIWRELSLLTPDHNIYEPLRIGSKERAERNARNVECLQRIVDKFSPDVIFVWNLYFFDESLISEISGKYGSKVVYFLTDNWLLSFYRPEFLQEYMAQALSGGNAETSSADSGHPETIAGEAVFGSRFMQELYGKAKLAFQGEHVVHNGVHLEDPPEHEFRDRLVPVRHGEYRLLFAGRVVRLKGLHVALAALPLIQKTIPAASLRLSVIGERNDSEYLSEIEGLVKKLGLSRCVEFLDPVSIDQLFGVFQDHDTYLFPSLYEPFALTLINALHAGIPTVASSVGGNVEIVEQGRSGVLVQKNDSAELARSVVELYYDPILRQRVSRGGRRAAWQFSFSRMVSDLHGRLHEIAQRARA